MLKETHIETNPSCFAVLIKSTVKLNLKPVFIARAVELGSPDCPNLRAEKKGNGKERERKVKFGGGFSWRMPRSSSQLLNFGVP